MSPACIRKCNKRFQSCLLPFVLPPECIKIFIFEEQIEGIVHGMFPRDGKSEKVGKDGESGELALGLSYYYALIDTNSSLGSPRRQ